MAFTRPATKSGAPRPYRVTPPMVQAKHRMRIFVRAIPYNYYAILTMVFIVIMTALNIDYGPMKTHEDNAVKGDLYTTGYTQGRRWRRTCRPAWRGKSCGRR